MCGGYTKYIGLLSERLSTPVLWAEAASDASTLAVPIILRGCALCPSPVPHTTGAEPIGSSPGRAPRVRLAQGG